MSTKARFRARADKLSQERPWITVLQIRASSWLRKHDCIASQSMLIKNNCSATQVISKRHGLVAFGQLSVGIGVCIFLSSPSNVWLRNMVKCVNHVWPCPDHARITQDAWISKQFVSHLQWTKPALRQKAKVQRDMQSPPLQWSRQPEGKHPECDPTDN